MQCRFCRFHNAEDDERCQQCGKRLSGDITFDGMGLAGATALAPQRRRSPLDESHSDTQNDTGGAKVAAAERQTSLFSGEVASNVIPFEYIPRPAANPAVKPAVLRNPTPAAHTASPATARPVEATQPVKKQATGNKRTADLQASLDLECLQPAPQAPRTLKTTVEASIYCDAEVATPIHRGVAAFLDASMILIGCGLFVGIFQLVGGNVHFDRFNQTMLGASLGLIAMFYGFLFAVAGRETPGQHWTELRLINFDGFPPDGPSRALRFAGTWLSCCACGIGLIWALMDEENLTWHDHMSKTFLTMREGDSPFFREGPR